MGDPVDHHIETPTVCLSLMPDSELPAPVPAPVPEVEGQSLHISKHMYAKPQSGDADIYIDILFKEGCLGTQFTVLQNLEEKVVPDTMELYIDETEANLDKLSSEIGQLNLDFSKMQDVTLDRELGQLNLDFSKVKETVIKMLSGSLSFGAAKVSAACSEIKRCCEEKSREELIKGFQKLRLEFIQVKHGLQTLRMMESTVVKL